jgi:hypothetical protein
MNLGSRALDACRRRSAEDLAQLAFSRLQAAPVNGSERPAGAVDVEVQHRHRRLELRPLRAPASAHRRSQAASDRPG